MDPPSGVLVALAGASAAFALTAALFGLAALAVMSWPRMGRTDPVGRERVLAGLRSGARYVRHAHSMRRVLLQCLFFVPVATVLWALLPVLARQQLNLGAQGFGMLLAALGAGALVGTLVLPHVRRRVPTNTLVFDASLLYSLSVAVLALTPPMWMVLGVLATAGAAWLALLSTLNASAQLMLPEWVRARALSYFIAVVGGSQTVGAVLWGVSASLVGLRLTLLMAAGVLAILACVARMFPLLDPSRFDPTPSVIHPPRETDEVLDAIDGPILVTVDYLVPVDKAEVFRESMRAVARVRKRTGARRWELYWDPAAPQRFLETFLVPSWEEHRRQHLGRMTILDRAVIESLTALLGDAGKVSHLLGVKVPSSAPGLSQRQPNQPSRTEQNSGPDVSTP